MALNNKVCANSLRIAAHEVPQRLQSGGKEGIFQMNGTTEYGI